MRGKKCMNKKKRRIKIVCHLRSYLELETNAKILVMSLKYGLRASKDWADLLVDLYKEVNLSVSIIKLVNIWNVI